MALRVVASAFRDTWQEFGTILLVNLLFLLAILLILPGPPAIVALFYYANRIVHEEPANEQDYLRAIRCYWSAGWRWGWVNLAVIGLLAGDYSLVGALVEDPALGAFVRGVYLALLTGWLLLQLVALPFLFEQESPGVLQALRNGLVFLRNNSIFSLTLGLLLGLSLLAGTLVFLLTFAFGGVFLAFAGNRAVVEHLRDRRITGT